ncbi:M48 family metalloprotease [Segnochrobactraceae bacterium EtOH-i3]
MARARRPGVSRAALLLAALVLAGCAAGPREPTITISEPVAQPAPAPAPAAAAAASEHPRLVAAYGGVYNDPQVERAIARAVGRLVAGSDAPSQSYRITILNSPAVNAFAMPGGYLYVTRGLLALANDTSEVAAVLAHEMAHVTADHAVARQRRAEAAAVVTKVAANVTQDQQVAKSAVAKSQMSLAQFSQAQELEADAIGVRTLGRAGYDPFAAARFLNSMGQYADLKTPRRDGGQAADFLSTHPATPERINMAIRAARGIGSPGIGSQDRDVYLKSLDGMLYGDDPREGFVHGRSFLHAELGIAFTAPAGFVLENTARAVLGTDGGTMAMRFDAVELSQDVSLSTYLASGWVKGLIPDSLRVTEVDGLQAATASAIADNWSFRIAVVREGVHVFRFIFATANPTPAFDRAFVETTSSFRRLSAAEASALRPLRIRIVQVRPGDTVDSLAARMTGIAEERRRTLFLVLNGLDPGLEPVAGSYVKIVSG